MSMKAAGKRWGLRTMVQSLPHPIANTLLMIRRLPTAFYEDGLLTALNADFRKTDRFKRVYAAATATGSFHNWNVRWRIHCLTWFAELASRVEGDFVECGTDHGGTAMAVMEHLDFGRLGRKFWLLDTFDGIDRSLLTEDEKAIEGGYLDYVDCFTRVKKNFAGRDYVRLVRGSIPSTLPQVKAGRIAFLHLDMNAKVPEMAALEHFWPMMPSGGVVLSDDYGWPRHREQKLGYDMFLAREKVSVLQLPTGQGVFIKP